MGAARRRRWIAALVLIGWLPAAGLVAGTADTVLVAPSGPVRAGSSAAVTLLVTNATHGPLVVDIPESSDCLLVDDVRRLPAALRPETVDDAGPHRVAPGGFLRIALTLDVPVDAEGPFFLDCPELSDRRVLLAVAPAPGDLPPRADAETEPAPSKTTVRAYFADNIFPYEPLYFLYGPEPSDAKFQISFQYRLFDFTDRPSPRRNDPLNGLFFGYTQTSIWDLESASKPFEDTSYKPEFFYLKENLGRSGLFGGARVDLQTGAQHESNGRDGAESRSLNVVYVRPTLISGDVTGYHWTVSPKFYVYVGDLTDNPDIYRYRGYMDFEIAYGKYDGFELAALLRKGTEGSNGSVQLDATYPLDRMGIAGFDFFLQGQIFTGYGESLLYYDRYDTRFRFGLSIIR